MKTDVIVLGAGIVGVAIALNLQDRGRDVVLVDRAAAGRGTSYGNAGIIQSEAILPYAFPQSLGTILAYALNNRRDMHYHLHALAVLAPALFRYWRSGRPDQVRRTVLANLPLFDLCLGEHDRLANAAGVTTSFRRGGWIKAFRTTKLWDENLADQARAATFGIEATVLDKAALSQRQPRLGDAVIGGIHYENPYSLANPLALTEAYAALFQRRGGRVVIGDARSLQPSAERWTVTTETGPISGRDAVLALGPWSDDVFKRLGYRVPFFVKRGYHLHFTPKVALNLPILDAEGGYVMAPMAQGIRVTTGVEFARRDAPPTPVQMQRILPWAHDFFPIGAQVELAPWLGSRPCLPDMLPVIAKAPAHRGLFFAFGHAHHGLTLAGVTGRLIAEMVAEEEPFTDPAPYRIDRF